MQMSFPKPVSNSPNKPVVFPFSTLPSLNNSASHRRQCHDQILVMVSVSNPHSTQPNDAYLNTSLNTCAEGEANSKNPDAVSTEASAWNSTNSCWASFISLSHVRTHEILITLLSYNNILASLYVVLAEDNKPLISFFCSLPISCTAKYCVYTNAIFFIRFKKLKTTPSPITVNR